MDRSVDRREQTELYIDPINKRFPEKYYWLFDGIDMVCGYAELTYNGLVGGTNAQNKGFISNLNDKEAYQNANIGLFLKNVLIKNLQLYILRRGCDVGTSCLCRMPRKQRIT